MADYFECLHCGTVSRVTRTRPLCRECGCGTGILRSRSSEELAEYAARDRKDDDTSVVIKIDR